MSEADLPLKALLSPVTEHSFFSDYWEKQSLHLSTDDPRRFEHVFTRRDIDQVITYTRPRFADTSAFQTIPSPPPTYVRGVHAGQSAHAAFEPGLADLRDAYDRGKSLVIMGMQHRWPAIASLCRGLEAVFHCPVHANLYLTPPGSQGFAAHYDPHEVFALQLDGTKYWRLYDRIERLPMMETVRMPEGASGQLRVVQLNSGDLLYIPRGHVHDAFTQEHSSLHLTVGINVYRWSDLLESALGCSIETDERLRESIPGGALPGDRNALKSHFKQLLLSLSDENHLDALLGRSLESLGTRFFRELKMLPDNQFAAFLTSEISAESILERSPLMICRILENQRGVAIEFPGNRVTGPPGIASALRFVASASQFRVCEMPDDLSPAAKLGLAKRLIHEGLLTVVDCHPTEAAEESTQRSDANTGQTKANILVDQFNHQSIGPVPLTPGKNHSRYFSTASSDESPVCPSQPSEPLPVSVVPA
nr:hypothetical protein Hi04_10k_c5016_00039 [uncultured bacterium]